MGKMKHIPLHLIPDGLTHNQRAVLPDAMSRWNAQADDFNQWDDISNDERLDLINQIIEDEKMVEPDADEVDGY